MTAAKAFALPAHPWPSFSRALPSLTLLAVTWELRRRTRKDLRNLTGHMLQDIGLDPMIADIEGAKPFWRA